MGQKSRIKRVKRDEARHLSAQLLARNNEIEADPVRMAALDAYLTDQAKRIIAADLPGQRERLQAAGWRCQASGDDGAGMWDHRRKGGTRILHSVSQETDGLVWGHTSVSHKGGQLPDWYEVRDAHRLLYPGQTGLVVIPPGGEHINVSEVAHAWTCLTARIIPDLRKLGSI